MGKNLDDKKVSISVDALLSEIKKLDEGKIRQVFRTAVGLGSSGIPI